MVSRWVANKQDQAARVYLPQIKLVWYEQAVSSGILQDIAIVARELGEEPIASEKRNLQYTWQSGEVTVYLDDDNQYLTVHVDGQLVCSTHPTICLFIPGHWLHMLAPYIERAHAQQQAWQLEKSNWSYKTDRNK